MHKVALLVALLTASLLAGCVQSKVPLEGTPPTEKSVPSSHTDVMCPDNSMHGDGYQCPEAPPTSSPAQRMTIRGVVLDSTLVPLGNATVRLVELNQTQAVSPAGTFEFLDLVPSTYFLTAAAPEFTAQTLTADPNTAKEALRFVLEALPTNVPFNETFHFHGHLQCALEVLIMSPSCDSVITADPINHEPVLNDTFSTLLPVNANWQTIVTDVVFDPSTQPGLDGLRVTVRGTYDAHELGTYVDYAQFNDSTPFTFRIVPGVSYPGGDNPVPSNTTQFELDTYPQSHGWHAVCVPPGSSTCFLGAGAGLDVDFDLYMTVFYVDPAPEGWTLRTA